MWSHTGKEEQSPKLFWVVLVFVLGCVLVFGVVLPSLLGLLVSGCLCSVFSQGLSPGPQGTFYHIVNQ